MILDQVLALPETQAMLRYQQENPQDRQARLVFTDYLRDHDLFEVADCLQRSWARPNSIEMLPGGSQYVYDGWVRTPEFEIAQGVRMKFCYIPAGKAKLGSPPDETDREDNEKEHMFKTAGFWLGKYTVTQEQWQSVMGNNPSHFKGAQLPVERISWNDCQEFVNKCAVLGFKVRLPHEDEWEYACRGGFGNRQAFYWGHALNGDKANCNGNYPYGIMARGSYLAKPAMVGSYEKVAPHPWGLCDMHGNVGELCENLYAVNREEKVLRGGCFFDFAKYCRSAYRYEVLAHRRPNDVGFRVVLVS